MIERANVFDANNYNELKAQFEKVANDARDSYKKDRFNGYCHRFFVVIGKEAVSNFIKDYLPDKKVAWRERPAIDKKKCSKTKLVPFLDFSYYYNARDEKSGITDLSWKGVDWLVEYDGFLLARYYWMNTENKPCEYHIFNDCTDYSDYLPYNYEEIHPRPNRVGVITDKKAEQWKNWLETRLSVYDAEKAKRENKATAFLDKLSKINKDDCTLYDVGNESGRIVKNNIEFKYTINKGVVSTSIGFYRYVYDFKDFLNMTGLKMLEHEN